MNKNNKKTRRTEETSHAWIQLSSAWEILGYLVIVSTLIGAFTFAGEIAEPAKVLSLTLGYTVWFATMWFFRPKPEGREVNAKVIALTLLGLLLWFLLIQQNMMFMWLLMTLYPRIFGTLPLPWASGVAVLVMVLWVWRMTDATGSFSWGIITTGLMMTAGALVMGFWIGAIIRQSMERARLVENLRKTRADLAQAERKAGVLDERQRLAREIHDTLAQSFAGIVTHLEAAEAVLEQLEHEPVPKVRGHLDQARTAARAGLTSARELVWALRPDLANRVAIDEALQRLVAEWSQSSGVASTLNVIGGPEPLAPEIEIALMRVCGEGLANIQKHANANQVNVTLSFIGAKVALDVQDNGNGFDPDQWARSGVGADGGFGLHSLQEQIESLGGAFSLESDPDDGSTLGVVLPRGPEPAKKLDANEDAP